jgi:hypothetical protein
MDIKELIKSLLSTKWISLQSTGLSSREGKYPGVYILAYSNDNLEGKEIDLNEIFYVGMSNSLGGVNQRLKQFLAGIEKDCCHSAARRFFRDYADSIPYSKLESRKTFYVAYISNKCQVTKASRTSEDLRMMGEVTRLEYYVLAHIKEMLGREPELNKK